MTKIINRNSHFPCSASRTFTTYTDNQPGITIYVYEGESLYTKDNYFVGQFDIIGLHPLPKGIPLIQVTFELNFDGILTISALEEHLKSSCRIIRTNNERLSEEEIKQMTEDFEKYQKGNDEDEIKLFYTESTESCLKLAESIARTIDSNKLSPLQKENLKKYVIYLNLVLTSKGPDVIPECSAVALEKHLKCGCECAFNKGDCSENQVYNPSKCRCECERDNEIEKCRQLKKVWDARHCECICPPEVSQICSTGSYFHQELCRCVPLNGHYPEPTRRRRRPPV
ncbi:heat shock 70 kDa protein [Caerostris extrusa]|uniref:Heat shock 70 kDa protein n=1 Tax=Caerostris extrusa TaxID=172846 RepID=A0AAV4NFJ1_CAEEX|nr:heat shock 70 kDa protein [Caerostris extrusa]